MANDVELAGGARVVAAAARAAPPGSIPPRTVDVVLEAFTTVCWTAMPRPSRLRPGARAAAHDGLRARGRQPVALARRGQGRKRGRTRDVGRRVRCIVLAVRQRLAARDTGALVHLQFALSFVARSHMLAGELSVAAAGARRGGSDRRGDRKPGACERADDPRGMEAAIRRQATALIDGNCRGGGDRRWISNAYARAVLCNGLGRYDEARDAS